MCNHNLLDKYLTWLTQKALLSGLRQKRAWITWSWISWEATEHRQSDSSSFSRVSRKRELIICAAIEQRSHQHTNEELETTSYECDAWTCWCLSYKINAILPREISRVIELWQFLKRNEKEAKWQAKKARYQRASLSARIWLLLRNSFSSNYNSADFETVFHFYLLIFKHTTFPAQTERNTL